MKDRRVEANPVDPAIYGTQARKIELEERNVFLQFAMIVRIMDERQDGWELTPGLVRMFHRLAVRGIYRCAGQYRKGGVAIRGSPHKPLGWAYVDGLVAEMCDKVNESDDWSPVKTAAYLLWRLSWIHPFSGGNGRTSRAVCHLVLCKRLGFLLPGKPTIAEQIDANWARYQAALEDADAASKDGVTDVSQMETLLEEFLQVQLSEPD